MSCLLRKGGDVGHILFTVQEGLLQQSGYKDLKEHVPKCCMIPEASRAVSVQCRERQDTPGVTLTFDAWGCLVSQPILPNDGQHLGVPLNSRVNLASKTFHQLLWIGNQIFLIFALENFVTV